MEVKKEKYNGLLTQRITVKSASLLNASRVTLKAKTKVQEWKTEDVDVEMGVNNMSFQDGSFSSRQGSWHTDF